MTSTTTIYALVDPRDGEVRYVGKTTNLTRRYQQHCGPAARRKPTHLSNWLIQLERAGCRPHLAILATEQDHTWEDAERAWIILFRALGCNLTNLTEGGEGRVGHRVPCSEEKKQRISAALLGKKLSPDRREKSSARMRGVAQGHRNTQGRTRMKGPSRFCGVSKPTQEGKWQAKIGYKGQQQYLGSFSEETDAAKAYDAAASELYGPDARLNFPLTSEEVSL